MRCSAVRSWASAPESRSAVTSAPSTHRAAFGDPGGWLFFIGMGLGAYISAKAVNWIANRKMAEMDMDFDIEL